MNFLCRQRREVGQKLRVIGRRIVAEEAADADGPGVVLQRNDHAVAPVRRAASNDDAELAAELARLAAIGARHVADADLDLVLDRTLIAELLEPCRARRAAPGSIEHEIGVERLLRPSLDAHTNAGHTIFGRACRESLHRAILDRAHVRQLQHTTTHVAFQHGTARQQPDQIALALRQRDVVTHPRDVVGDIAEQATALGHDLVAVARKKFFEHDTATRQQAVGVAALRDALARDIVFRERVALEDGDGCVEIRQRAGSQQAAMLAPMTMAWSPICFMMHPSIAAG